MKTEALRFETLDRKSNLKAITDVLKLKQTKVLTLYVSPPNNPFTDAPLLSGVVQYIDIPHFSKKFLLFDGQFLSSSDPAGHKSIKLLVDYIIKTNPCPVYFYTKNGSFTAFMEPLDAVDQLLKFDDVERLTEKTRARFYDLIFQTEKDAL